MRIIAFFILMFIADCSLAQGALFSQPLLQTPTQQPLGHELLGSPVFIQIFKQEHSLDLYAKVGNQFKLINRFDICKFSGGLGPKRVEGDFKSPEGFYSISANQLHPDSHYYRAINLGFPNQFDRENGYNGNYLMIHGNCVSIGCYAMTDSGIAEIYRFASAAIANGQTQINVNIYPFRMTDENMARHANSSYANFWKQLKPGYDYFEKHHLPPRVMVNNGQYVIIGVTDGKLPTPPPGNPFHAAPANTVHHLLAFTQQK